MSLMVAPTTGRMLVQLYISPVIMRYRTGLCWTALLDLTISLGSGGGWRSCTLSLALRAAVIYCYLATTRLPVS